MLKSLFVICVVSIELLKICSGRSLLPSSDIDIMFKKSPNSIFYRRAVFSKEDSPISQDVHPYVEAEGYVSLIFDDDYHITSSQRFFVVLLNNDEFLQIHASIDEYCPHNSTLLENILPFGAYHLITNDFTYELPTMKLHTKLRVNRTDCYYFGIISCDELPPNPDPESIECGGKLRLHGKVKFINSYGQLSGSVIHTYVLMGILSIFSLLFFLFYFVSSFKRKNMNKTSVIVSMYNILLVINFCQNLFGWLNYKEINSRGSANNLIFILFLSCQSCRNVFAHLILAYLSLGSILQIQVGKVMWQRIVIFSGVNFFITCLRSYFQEIASYQNVNYLLVNALNVSSFLIESIWLVIIFGGLLTTINKFRQIIGKLAPLSLAKRLVNVKTFFVYLGFIVMISIVFKIIEVILDNASYANVWKYEYLRTIFWEFIFWAVNGYLLEFVFPSKLSSNVLGHEDYLTLLDIESIEEFEFVSKNENDHHTKHLQVLPSSHNLKIQ
eukprot:TRINITY_DN14544_c0_g1_i1.p1 TRINITY_DN14544_c0_g1~~TRINITY_DN14544_c0_g1_i1.p1  ORF type:complete len:498 (+),score=102.16 TRINITY_DN14544_c0_g1_i1:97-1590(+)